MGNCQQTPFKTQAKISALPKTTINIEDIVDRVLNGEFSNILSTKNYEKIEIKKIYVDPDQVLKNIATDFVVKEFFRTDAALFNFMELIYTTYANIISYYANLRNLKSEEIFFVHKGGNILRLVSTEFILELPGSVAKDLAKFYYPYFKRSDADFSIYLSPKINDYENIYQEVCLISFLALDYIRNEFINNPEIYFDYFKYNKIMKKSIHKKFLDRINRIEGYKFEKLFLGVTTNKDTMIVKNEIVNNEEIRKITLNKGNTIFSNSFNSALDIERNKSRAKFSLIRMKTMFELKLPNTQYLPDRKEQVGGELIDVTIQHRDDSTLPHFFKNIGKYVTTYNLFHNGKELIFKSYTIHYLIEDLEEIIFKENKYPWDDKKYTKRIYRLFYLYFMEIFITSKHGDNRREILEIFRNFLYMFQETDIEVKKIMSFTTKCKKYEISKLMEYLFKLHNTLSYDDDRYFFHQLITILINNVNNILVTINKVHSYCITDGDINYQDIYHTSSKQLL